MTRLAVIADIHYYSPRLGVSGRAYELRSGADQKCLAESGAVFDEAARLLIGSDIEAVLVAGDLTNNGERFSHEEIYEKLRALDEKKSVYPIVSTHDWCSDNNPRAYAGNQVFKEIETLDREELNRLYGGFGGARLISSFEVEGGLVSRCFQLNSGVRLLAVHDDCNGRDGKSGYDERHLLWAENEIKSARAAGQDIIAMQHHLLLYGINRLVNGSQAIADNIEAANRLADAGLRLVFTGHSHMHRITEHISPAGNKITQVNVGALCGYPAPVVFAEIDENEVRIKTQFLEGFTYKGRRYGAEFFKEHTLGALHNILNAADDRRELQARLDAQGIDIDVSAALYPLMRAVINGVRKMRAGTAGNIINFLSFGKGVERSVLKKIKDDSLIEIVSDIFLNVFDGSFTAKNQKPAAKRAAFEIAALPERFAAAIHNEKLMKTAAQIKETAAELLYPSAPDNLNCVISLK